MTGTRDRDDFIAPPRGSPRRPAVAGRGWIRTVGTVPKSLANVFDDLTDVYEAMIDWPRRLANEGPFYRRCFERVGAASVADVACGTGRHAALFHSWNLRVEGSDVSPRMIDRRREHFRRAGRFALAGARASSSPSTRPSPSTPCCAWAIRWPWRPTRRRPAARIGQMLAAVRPGGAVVVHLLNLWRLPDGPCVWQKCRRATLPQGEVLIVKGVHRAGGKGYVELVVAGLDAEPALRTESVPLVGLEAAELERAARRGGAAEVAFFGGYQEQPYDRSTSVDLLMVARK